MRSFLEEGGFSAFTTTFEDLHGLTQLPGLAVQRLMADGYGFGAEGDWKTAALVRAAFPGADRSAVRNRIEATALSLLAQNPAPNEQQIDDAMGGDNAPAEIVAGALRARLD